MNSSKIVENSITTFFQETLHKQIHVATRFFFIYDMNVNIEYVQPNQSKIKLRIYWKFWKRQILAKIKLKAQLLQLVTLTFSFFRVELLVVCVFVLLARFVYLIFHFRNTHYNSRF